ncbi:MAG: leucine-rich repeat domain-containing protein [Oscillospiraceae bacterium]|nr:leucine-rich repeat domain-containing protein [Oscillospiraceae bacterium]
MRRILSLALTLVLFAAVQTPYARAETDWSAYNVSGDFVYNIASDGVKDYAGIIRYTGGASHLTIPSVLDGKQVISITGEAFMGCEALVSVSIPDGVTNIDYRAFCGCTLLEEVNIPDSVQFLSSGVFCDTALYNSQPDGLFYHENWLCGTKGEAPSGQITVKEGTVGIAAVALGYCPELTAVTIPDGVKSIGDLAFMDCDSLSVIHIGYGLQYTGRSAFFGLPDSALIYVPDNHTRALIFRHGEQFAGIPPSRVIPISDKPSGWAEAEVNRAIQEGLVPARLCFGYAAVITRAEFCALAVGLYERISGKSIEERGGFDDTDDINVQKLAGLGIIRGDGDGKFDPNGGFNREMAITLMYNMMVRLGYEFEDAEPDFADAESISPWARQAAGALQKAGIVQGGGDGSFNPQEDFTREMGIVTMLRLYDWITAPAAISIRVFTYSTDLTELNLFDLGDLSNADIEPLKYMTKLTMLELSPRTGGFNENRFSDISPLAGLTELTALGLSYNNVSDLSPIEGLTNLTSLGLTGNKISDISPLAGLTKLTVLSLDDNGISDISPLANLTELTWLRLSGNQISDAGALKGLTKLREIQLYGNPVSEEQITQLQAALPECDIITQQP